jgi:hypothetical protein
LIFPCNRKARFDYGNHRRRQHNGKKNRKEGVRHTFELPA